MKKIIFFLFVLSTLVSCKQFFGGNDLQYMPFRESEKSKWGLIGTDGKVLCTDEFDSQPTVVMNDRFFAKNKDGKWELFSAEENPKQIGRKAYDMAGAFKDDVAPVSVKGKPIQFIDKDGNVKFDLDRVDGKKVEAVTNFTDGVAIFSAEGGVGLFDNKGKVIVNPEYLFIKDAGDGKYLAIEKKYKDAKDPEDVNITILSKHGNVLGEIEGRKYSNLLPCFSGDNLCVEKRTSGDNHRWGVIDVKGNEVLPMINKMDNVTEFLGKKFIFEKDDQYGLMNVDGDIIIRSKYKNLTFSGADGLLFAADDDNNVKLINEDDEQVSKDSYINALSFHGSYAAVQESKDNWIFINKKGENQKVNTDIYDISDSNFGDEIIERDDQSTGLDFSSLFDNEDLDSTEIADADSVAVDTMSVTDYDSDYGKSTMQSSTYNMTGYVDKYPITMYITFDGNDATGWYYYNKYKSKMTFTGTLDGSSLDLYCDGGDTFTGTFVDGAYSGHFSGGNGTEFSFNVSQ